MRKIVFYSWPLALILAYFVWDDPFSVIHRENGIAEKSDDILEVKTFRNTVDSAGYNTFIFGNSRANSLEESALLAHLDSTHRFFRFNAPGDCIQNIYKKLKSVKESNCDIKFAIILIDNGILENSDNKCAFYKGPVYEHSVHTSDIGYFDFYSRFINYYFSDFFFAKHIYFKSSGKYKPWMEKSFPKPVQNPGLKKGSVSPTGHATPNQLKDSLLENDFAAYKKKYNPLYQRKFDTTRIQKEINEVDMNYLKEIKAILDEKKTKYYIFIPPAFSQIKFNKHVKEQLESFFGNRVVDFSGVNKITTDSTLNYENLHFSRKAGKMIIDSLFKLDKKYENN